jgi:hypoxanthine phosphoribosyltransferase
MQASAEIQKLTGGRAIEEIVFAQDRIAHRVAELGAAIGEHYASGDLLVIGLLKGSFVFLADLIRTISRPLHVDFVIAASYGASTTSSGRVQLLYQPETSVDGKHVLLVEDIVDSGNTLNRLAQLFRAWNPRSLEVCTLLHKKSARLETPPRFVGFEAPDAFLVGYGLDHAEDFRHLPFIATIAQSS